MPTPLGGIRHGALRSLTVAQVHVRVKASVYGCYTFTSILSLGFEFIRTPNKCHVVALCEGWSRCVSDSGSGPAETVILDE